MSPAAPPGPTSALAGCEIIVAIDRRSHELAAALERHGAHVTHAPALTIVPHVDDVALLAATRCLVRHPPDVVVVTTGVGFRGWMEAAEEAGLRDPLHQALAQARIVARGPKARGAIQQAGLVPDWVAESETSAEVGSWLVDTGVAGTRVAVQHHGAGSDGLDELLVSAGAEVVSLTVYRWGPPPDSDVVRRAVETAARGGADAVVFTSAPGASAWLAAASEHGVLEEMVALAGQRRLLLAAVGPVTAAPLTEAGVEPFVAERGRLGSLVRGVVRYFGGGHAPSLPTPAGQLQLRSAGVVLDDRFIPLPPAGAAVVAELFAAGGAVVTSERLGALACPGASPHAVVMAVARVREAVGAPGLVRTVVRRGYRLDVSPNR